MSFLISGFMLFFITLNYLAEVMSNDGFHNIDSFLFHTDLR